METKIQRMKELIPVLKEAGKAYYQESREITGRGNRGDFVGKPYPAGRL